MSGRMSDARLAHFTKHAPRVVRESKEGRELLAALVAERAALHRYEHPEEYLSDEQVKRIESILAIGEPKTDAQKVRFMAAEIDLRFPGDTEPEMQLDMLRIADEMERAAATDGDAS